MIIGICGFISSGKDTIADYLVNTHGFRRESFASSLKDAVASVFHWDRNLLEGRSKESRAWREEVDTWWAQRLNMPQLTPRWVLQCWGTEVIRNGFHDDMWIASVECKLKNSRDDIVITDCRFPNEIQAIKNAGGMVIWVQRGPLPEWYDCALTQNTTHEDELWVLNDHHQLMEHRYPAVHASEFSWIGTNFDAVLKNSSTVEQLYQQVNNLLVNHHEPS